MACHKRITALYLRFGDWYGLSRCVLGASRRFRALVALGEQVSRLFYSDSFGNNFILSHLHLLLLTLH